MTRYKCPDCGEYEISSMAKETLQDSKSAIQKIIKDAEKKLSDDEIVSISTKSIKVEKR